MKTLTQERLKELIHYDPDTGVFSWRVDRGHNKTKGMIAGNCNTLGYIDISINDKHYYAHRIAFLYMEGFFPENEVDHINRIRHDNKWRNLKHVSRQCNMRNQSLSKANTSGITGVTWHKGGHKWVSQIMVAQKNKYLGLFKTLKEAAQARWEAEVKYNFPNCNSTSSAYLFLQGVDNE
jgi:hypothetical protein